MIVVAHGHETECVETGRNVFGQLGNNEGVICMLASMVALVRRRPLMGSRRRPRVCVSATVGRVAVKRRPTPGF